MFDAASISIMSGFPLNERQFSHLPHAIPVLLSKQLIDLAKILAVDVFPVPLDQKINMHELIFVLL